MMEKRAEAHWLRADGLTLREIGERLGVSMSTIARWLDPEKAEQQRRQSREAKRRRRGTCRICGKPTGYNGNPGKAVSDVHVRCLAKERRYWTAERVTEAIRIWHAEHGRLPTAEDWRTRIDPRYPTASNVYRSSCTPGAPFASWNEAIEAAGFTPIARGHYERTPEIREKIAAAQRRRWAREKAAA